MIKEHVSSTYAIALNFEGELLSGIVEPVSGSHLYRVWIPGVCLVFIRMFLPGRWEIEIGGRIINDLVQMIGQTVEQMF